MPVTSVLIECAPGFDEEVAASVAALPSTAVHNRMAQFVVAVTSTRSRKADDNLLRDMAQVPGVITATPVFTNCEDINLDLGPEQPEAGWEV